LSQNFIDQNTKNTLRIFYDHYFYGKLLYTYNRVGEPTIDTKDMTLYIKFIAHEQSYSQRRYLNDLQPFSIKILWCIFEQLTISSTEYMHWLEKSIYTKKIEYIYDRNPKVFNQIVIKKCDILIGHFYRPIIMFFSGTHMNIFNLANMLDYSMLHLPILRIYLICFLFPLHILYSKFLYISFKISFIISFDVIIRIRRDYIVPGNSDYS